MSSSRKGITYSRLFQWRKLFLQHYQPNPGPTVAITKSTKACFKAYSTSSDSGANTDLGGNPDIGPDSKYDVMYPGHITTSVFQKSLLAFGSGIACLVNPARDDMICALGETTGSGALAYMQRKMLAHPVGRQILEEKPLINTQTVDVSYLGSLPEGTFGKEYWHFLNKNGFSPDARRPVNFVDDPDLMYVMLRYRQCHDLVHTLLGMPPNMLGEVAVKWFEAVQTGLPMCVTAALFGPVRLGPKHRQKYVSIYLPWAVRSAYNSEFVLNIYFEKCWEQDMDELRKEFGVEPAPVPLIKTGRHTMTK